MTINTLVLELESRDNNTSYHSSICCPLVEEKAIVVHLRNRTKIFWQIQCHLNTFSIKFLSVLAVFQLIQNAFYSSYYFFFCTQLTLHVTAIASVHQIHILVVCNIFPFSYCFTFFKIKIAQNDPNLRSFAELPDIKMKPQMVSSTIAQSLYERILTKTAII